MLGRHNDFGDHLHNHMVLAPQIQPPEVWMFSEGCGRVPLDGFGPSLRSSRDLTAYRAVVLSVEL